ncbi:MAG: hypothetical protein Q7J06_11000 [Bacteroidales bacterium]|nr:hypothetical protein [Bacteroidales bacterium]
MASQIPSIKFSLARAAREGLGLALPCEVLRNRAVSFDIALCLPAGRQANPPTQELTQVDGISTVSFQWFLRF